MRVLNVEESAHWLAERAIELRPATERGSDHRVTIPEGYERLCFETPRQPADQVALAHLLSEWFLCRNAMLVVNVVALFQPHELEAFLFTRHFYGDRRWVDSVPGGATPGHLFDDSQHSQRDIRELLIAMMAFTFEGYFVQSNGATILWVADEVIDVAVRDPGQLARPRELVALFDLKAW